MKRPTFSNILAVLVALYIGARWGPGFRDENPGTEVSDCTEAP